MKDYWLKRILVNSQKININSLLENSDVLTIDISEKNNVPPSNKICDVVYEDDLVLIVRKGSHQIIHDDQKNDALINDVSKYFEENNYHRLVRPIHRLDEMTQGLVFFSKILFLQPYFDYLLKNKIIKRKYLAITKGRFKNNKNDIIIEKRIGRDRHINNKYIINPKGKEAKTKIRLIKYINGYSLVECELFTGRTHQIRVHLSSIGLPIVNDEIYGIKDTKFKNMGLYAYKLNYLNPLTNELKEIVYKKYDDLKYFE